MATRRMIRQLCAVLLIPLLGGSLFAQAPRVSVSSEPEKELALGAKLAEHIEQRDGRLQDAAILGYVRRLGTKLSGISSRPPLDIRLTGSFEQYATLLPGRILYLSSGLLLRMATEAELAAILAHEQAHSPAMHFWRANTGSIVVSFGDCVLSSPLVPLSWASSMRQFEVQANVIAVRSLRAAHYDPASLFVILSKLVGDDEAWNRAFVSDDLDTARGAVESEPVPAEGYIADSSAFVAMHEEVERIAGVSRQSNITLFRR